MSDRHARRAGRVLMLGPTRVAAVAATETDTVEAATLPYRSHSSNTSARSLATS